MKKILRSAAAKRQVMLGAFEIFATFLKYLRRHRRKIVALAVFTLLSSLFGVITPLLVKYMVDNVIPATNWPMFRVILIGYLSVSLAMQGITIYQGYISLCMRQQVRASLSSAYFRHLLRLPLANIRRRQAGAHIFRTTSDIDSVTGLVTSFFTTIPSNLVSLVAAVGIMFKLQWKVTLIYIVFVPIAFLVRVYGSLKIRPLQKELREHNEGISGFLGQTFSGINVIKTFGAETAEALKYLRVIRDNIRINFRMWLTRTLLEQIQWLFNSGVGSFLQWWIWFMVMKQFTSLGSAMAISWYFSMIMSPFMSLASTAQTIIAGMVPGERVFQTLQATRERLHEGVRIPARDLQEGVAFRNVTFSYSDEHPILRDVSLRLKPGTVNALVGPSGSGKTTVVNLICGLYANYEGDIEIDNIPMNEVAIASLRKLIALVPQEPFIFEASVADNIGYGNKRASRQDVIRAAKMANIHQRILELPEGYDTVVEGGQTGLSTGEKQRITVARAFLRDAPVMLFDEAFSHLDAEAEHEVIGSLKHLQGNRTILIITHRLNSILFTDNVVVLKEGRVVESGPPKQLIREKGEFAKWVDLREGKLQIPT